MVIPSCCFWGIAVLFFTVHTKLYYYCVCVQGSQTHMWRSEDNCEVVSLLQPFLGFWGYSSCHEVFHLPLYPGYLAGPVCPMLLSWFAYYSSATLWVLELFWTVTLWIGTIQSMCSWQVFPLVLQLVSPLHSLCFTQALYFDASHALGFPCVSFAFEVLARISWLVMISWHVVVFPLPFSNFKCSL